jgi:DNA/RNA endonuclease YhcR with UshA esterase domain
MRLTAGLFLLSFVTTILAEDAPKALTPAEAVKKVNEKVTVEMEVKSTGTRSKNHFLNSAANYRDAENLTVFIPKESVEKFKKAKIDNPGMHFKGKTIRVTGTVILYREKPEIKVEDPEQIKIVEKK